MEIHAFAAVKWQNVGNALTRVSAQFLQFVFACVAMKAACSTSQLQLVFAHIVCTIRTPAWQKASTSCAKLIMRTL